MEFFRQMNQTTKREMHVVRPSPILYSNFLNLDQHQASQQAQAQAAASRVLFQFSGLTPSMTGLGLHPLSTFFDSCSSQIFFATPLSSKNSIGKVATRGSGTVTDGVSQKNWNSAQALCNVQPNFSR